MKHDIRCKGTLSDEDLAREWIRRGTLMWTCTAYGGGGPVDRSDIEKELGKDRLEFLVFKIKTEERLEKLEKKDDTIQAGFSTGGSGCCVVYKKTFWNKISDYFLY